MGKCLPSPVSASHILGITVRCHMVYRYQTALLDSPLFWQLNRLVIKISHETTNMTPMAPSITSTQNLSFNYSYCWQSPCNSGHKLPRASHHSLPLFFLPSPPSQSFLPFPSQLPVLSCSRRAQTLPRSVVQASHFIRAEPSNEQCFLSHLSRCVSPSHHSFILWANKSN